MPTHTHIFSNRNNGYDYWNTATCGVPLIAVKQNREGFGFGFKQRRDYDF
jgi:hypothetical protein